LVAPERDGAIAFLLPSGVWHIAPDGSLRQLTAPLRELRYTTSMVTDPNGAIYIGMDSVVTRLTPGPSGYREDWLVPDDCTTVRGLGFDCRCDRPLP
jgi:hypothetical protein